MKTLSKKLQSIAILSTCFACILLSLSTLETQAQFQIAAMEVNGSFATSATLTIIGPQGKAHEGVVDYDPQKQYSSGTTFMTPANTRISIFFSNQTVKIEPNSTLKMTSQKGGVKAHLFKGKIQNILSDVKNNLAFYKAGNDYTWAHAEGTDFWVEAVTKSQNIKFKTDEGKIAILEEAKVSISEQAKNAQVRNGKTEERELTKTTKTFNTAGEEYSSHQLPTISYYSYEEALAAFELEVTLKEVNGDAYSEELADDFTLLGELYLDNGQADMAIRPFEKAFSYNLSIDPEQEDFFTLESYLYLCEALISTDDENNQFKGSKWARESIPEMSEIRSEDTNEYNWAIDNGENDYAWELAYDLADINDYLGWAHELLGLYEEADAYYNEMDFYEAQLEKL